MRHLLEALLPTEPWRRNQVAVTAAAGLIFFGFTLVFPFFPFFVESLGARGKAIDVWSGVLLSSAPLLAAVMAPFWGRMAGRYGMKRMIQRTLVAMVIHWVLMLFATNLWEVLGLRILLGVSSGFGTMAVALVTQGAPKEKIGWVVGTLESVQILSAASGPFVGGILYDSFGLRPTFAITAAFCALGLGLINATYSDRPETGAGEAAPAATSEAATAAGTAAPQQAAEPRGFLGVLRIRGVLPIIAMLFCATVISRSFGLVVPLYLKEIATGSSLLGIITGVTISLGSFAEALSSMSMGRLAERVGPQKLLLAGLSTAVILLLPMPFVRNPWEFLVLRILIGLATGGAMTLGYTMGGAILPERGRAVSYSVLSAAAMLGGAIGPSMCGLVSWLAGLRVNFAIAAGLYAILASFTFAGLRRETAERLARERAEAAALVHHEKGSGEKPYIPVPR